jgi:signal transduction histidine kinase
VLHDMTERRLAEELLRTRLLSRLATIQEDERRRFARELHDQTGQQLAALALGLKALRERPDTPAAAAGALGSLQELAEQTGRAAHQLAWELRPTALDDLGLETALRHWVARWSERSQVPADFHCTLGPGRLPPDLETHLYRLTHEALSNVWKHAKATRVSVILQRRPDHLLAIVEDNGRGFDPAARGADGAAPKLGLYGMQERAALMGGTLSVESGPGQGTTVFVRVPLGGRKGASGDDDPRPTGG